MVETEENPPRGGKIMREEYLLSQKQKENISSAVEFTFYVGNESVGATGRKSSWKLIYLESTTQFTLFWGCM